MAEKELKKIVGPGNVLTGPEALEEYAGDGLFAPAVTPRCVVRPGSVEEVQAVVKWADTTMTPLVPVSSGAPHFRGDTVPGAAGAVILDLKRMNRIVRVDPRNKLAMVEPGVTFGELQAELAKSGLCAYLPLAPRANKSVIGSVMEREPITFAAHHWDSCDPLLCAEVVYGTGDRFRTGEASGPDTPEEQWEMDRVQMNPFGHSHVDFQRLISGAQGTMGIVTWATVKCNYLSRVSRALMVPSATLQPLIDLMYLVVRCRLGGKLFIVNGLDLACLLGGGSREVKKRGKSLPPWVLFISFEGYGPLPEDKVAAEEAEFREMAKQGGLEPVGKVPGATAAAILKLLSGPSAEPYWKTRFKGGFRDIFFLTTLDKTPEFATAVPEMAGRYGFPAGDIGVYIQPIVQGTSCHAEFTLYYDGADAAGTAAVKRLDREGVAELAGMGGFFSRPYGAWADAAYRRAPGTLAMQRKLKEIFDPHGILNPGKLGFRELKAEEVR
ncbi:MAG TPA: FAD-binding oxidoreductase [Dehalococcoidales bacterium]|nr:MAG: hypothetical protein A2Z05_02135 [Chloroflexi bacterium RBG_16_60_22]HJX13876.1 FAD-binding oxidoreductase [Dehalococcoidales bacterium]